MLQAIRTQNKSNNFAKQKCLTVRKIVIKVLRTIMTACFKAILWGH